MSDAGRPPVGQSRAVQPAQEPRLDLPTRNYLTIVDTLKANKGAEAKAIRAMLGGDDKLVDQFLAMTFSILQSKPDLLADCTPMSLVQVIKDAAALGLVPMTEDAAVIPYGNKAGEKIAQLQPMWRGYVKRIRNSREVVDLDVQLVYMNDLFEIELGTHPGLKHVPKLYGEVGADGENLDERGDFRGVYAWALMPSGLYIIEWMTTDDVNYVRDTWGAKNADAWKKSWSEMARKTVIRRLAKRLPAAAVDKLLELDKANDEAAVQLKAVRDDAKDALSEVRNLALQAVGQLPAGPTTDEEPPGDKDQPPGQEEPPAGDGGAAVPSEDKPRTGGPGAAAPPPPEDPNVSAAMAMAAEQERLARRR